MNSTSKIVRHLVFIGTLIALAYLVLNVSVPNTSPKPTPTSEPIACGINSPLTGEFDLSDTLALFEETEIELTDINLATNTSSDFSVLGSTVSSEERWIEVDLSEQKLLAWEGNELFLESAISSGLPHTPTPTGEFRVWIKLRATKMEGGSGRYYYYLPNVPFVMFFSNDAVPAHKGYGLHGTYWHSDFGTPRSHGCVNLPNTIAEQLYYWTSPAMEENKFVARASDDNPGTRIIIHQ